MKMVSNFSTRKAVESAPPVRKSIVVSQYMTRNLVTFKADQSVREVMDKMVQHKISGGPVVDDDGGLIGIISVGDCLKQVVRAKYHNLPQDKELVRDHMNKEVITIAPDKDIFEAANQFLTNKLRRFPVLENGKLTGMISQRDVMTAVMKLSRTTW